MWLPQEVRSQYVVYGSRLQRQQCPPERRLALSLRAFPSCSNCHALSWRGHGVPLIMPKRRQCFLHIPSTQSGAKVGRGSRQKTPVESLYGQMVSAEDNAMASCVSTRKVFESMRHPVLGGHPAEPAPNANTTWPPTGGPHHHPVLSDNSSSFQ